MAMTLKASELFELADIAELVAPKEGWGTGNNNRVYMDAVRDAAGNLIGKVPTLPLGIQLTGNTPTLASNIMTRVGIAGDKIPAMFAGKADVPRRAAAEISRHLLNTRYLDQLKKKLSPAAFAMLSEDAQRQLVLNTTYSGYSPSKAFGLMNSNRWDEAANELNVNKLLPGSKKRVARLADMLRQSQ